MRNIGSHTWDVVELPAVAGEKAETGTGRASVIVLTSADLAECTCPEPCERDHELD